MLNKIKDRIVHFFKSIRDFIRNVNRSAEQRYSPSKFAAVTIGIVFVLAVIMLFFPPYIGMSNDGSFDAVLQDTNLARLNKEDTSAYYNYYEREYVTEVNSYKPDTTPIPLRAIVNVAVIIDRLFTGDSIFDVRVLAALYLLIYCFALYPLLRFAFSRTDIFFEGVIILVVAVLMFADVSTISYFSSFSSKPIEIISIAALTGSLLMGITKDNPIGYYLIVFASLLLLLVTNSYTALGGFVFVGVLIALMLVRKEILWRTLCIMMAILTGLISFSSLNRLSESQTDIDKYNSMTRGVLLQSQNPEETLSEFEIEQRFSVLADTYANQNYPIVLMDVVSLREGFLSKYNETDIALYYLRHPFDLFNMFDVSVVSSYNTRPDYSGNYEAAEGKQPRAKAVFLSIWSSFKTRSAPQTSGFFLVIAIGALIIYWRKRKADKLRESAEGPPNEAVTNSRVGIWLVLFALVLFAVVNIITLIIFSGDGLIITQSFLFAGCTDILTLLLLAEILNRINIVRDSGKG